MFNSTGGFAPAMTLNRDESLIPNEDASKKGNVTVPASADYIKAYVNNALSKQANSQLKIEVVPNTDETQATVIINGTCNEALDIDKSLLTLYITEDSIKAKKQSGARDDYQHMHVIRYYNSIWGDIIIWKNASYFTATYNIDIDPEWKKDNLNVVVFINKHDDSDYTNNKIDNSAGIAYKASTTGINGIYNNNNAKEIARYTLDGTKVSTPVKGLNIVKMSDGRTVKVMVK